MSRAAMLVLAGTKTKADLGRVVNALQAAREFKESGGDPTMVFDGARVQWVLTLSDPEHRNHELWEQVGDVVKGACNYCVGAFGVKQKIEESGEVDLLDEFDGHPSIRKLIEDGYQVLTF